MALGLPFGSRSRVQDFGCGAACCCLRLGSVENLIRASGLLIVVGSQGLGVSSFKPKTLSFGRVGFDFL